MGLDLNAGKGRGARPSINITPLVDVVLVLLIIFMVVTPLLTRQFWLSVPRSESTPAATPPGDEPAVLAVDARGALTINRDPIERGALTERLRRVFAGRGDHALYVSIDDEAPYGAALEAMDLARAAGATPIALITERL